MPQPTGSKGSSPGQRPTQSSAAAMTDEGLHKIGKYEIRRKIGAGGMGAVFLAVDTVLNRPVALKVLPQDKADNPTLRKRFKAEGESAANLRHDNIVMVYDANEADGYLYIAMEYINGQDVANLVQKRGVLPVKRSIEIIRQTALALQHAYEKGIVHRDIKPGNIMIRDQDGMAKLADMGLARAVDDHAETSITRAGTTVGTVDYMSPEQARDSKAADVRSDLYSLGCTWYYMLTGSPPYPDGSMTNKLRAHASNPFPDPRSINPSVTEAVFAVMRRMSEKDPAQRYQTPAEMLADLETASIAADNVSAAILGELDDSGAPTKKKRARRPAVDDADDGGTDDDETQTRRRPGSPNADIGVPVRKPRGARGEKQTAELKRAIPFYTVVGLVILLAFAGLAWLAIKYGAAVDGPSGGPGSNPFAAEQAQGGRAVAGGPGAPTAGETPDGTGTTGEPGAGQAPVVGAGQSNAGNPNVAAGQPGTAAQSRVVKVGDAGDESGASPGGLGATGLPGAGSGQSTGADAPRDGGSPPIVGTGGTAGGSVGGTPGKTPGSIGTGTVGGAGITPGGKSGSTTVGGAKGPGSGPAAEARRKTEDKLLPGWALRVGSPGAGAQLPKLKLTVRRGPTTSPNQFATLNEALDKVSPEGATIVLEGSGPFPLTPVKIEGKARLVVMASGAGSGGEPPLVVLYPSQGAGFSGVLSLINTVAEFHDLHLGLNGESVSSRPEDALIELRGGELTLRHSSITVSGSGPATTAIQVAQGNSPDDSSGVVRLLLDQTVVRGDNLTSLAVSAPGAEIVVRNSLLWSGAATGVQLSGSGAESAKRSLKFVSTTLCSQVRAITIGGDPQSPAPTALEWTNSLVASPKGLPNPALCVFDGWSAEQHKGVQENKTLTWKSVGSRYLGFATLIRREPGTVSVAEGGTQWLQAWKDKGAGGGDQFSEAPWPARQVADIARVPLELLSPESTTRPAGKATVDEAPGCFPAVLSVADLSPLDVQRVVARRPAAPAGLFGGPAASEVIQVDLTKHDLGKFLAERKLKMGARIVASGSGVRQTSPIVIRNVWVRLNFVQTDGPPLVLAPRSSEGSRGGNAGTGTDAMITVSRGGLEIVGGAFTIPAGVKASWPQVFIQAIDSDLVLRQCRLQGPLDDRSRQQGLVQWLRREATPPERPFVADRSGYAAFDGCYLIGSGVLVQADLRQRALFFRDCVLASRDDVLGIQLGGLDPQIGGALDLESTTLSAGGNFLQLAGAELATPTNAPLVVTVSRCVFAPGVRGAGRTGASTLLACADAVLATRQISWWEDHCGYSLDIGTFHRSDATSATAQNFTASWLERWGSAQVVAPLTGPQGVYLRKDLPQKPDERARLEPIDFALHPSSKAATWDGGERSIGAPLANLHIPPIRGPAGASTGTAGTSGKKDKGTKPAGGGTKPGAGSKPAF
ncbi:MAG: protein kinase domain-containing protein [Planctomycetales bacterium]